MRTKGNILEETESWFKDQSGPEDLSVAKAIIESKFNFLFLECLLDLRDTLQSIDIQIGFINDNIRNSK